MSLLKYKELINTECRVPEPILCIKAIKIDANTQSLKRSIGWKGLKSCDYFRRNKKKFYFIEISDFHAQFKTLRSSKTPKDAIKDIKVEIRLKLSETLLIYQQLLEQFKFKKENCELKKKALLSVCRENLNSDDTIFLDRISRELSRHYCPKHLSSIQIIPYTDLEKIFK